MQLTDRQKELLQADKYVLVDTIILLEDKLLKALEKINHLNNEMLLNAESLKSELEIERDMRVKLEKAHITAQEELDELDSGVKNLKGLDNDAFLHAIQENIAKYYGNAIDKREKERTITKAEEEGWNGEI